VSVPERRTQEERRTGTQRALLRATIECLVEYGYAGTTTRLVADRAEVSRGAQTHHYPTKRDLVVAAIEQLFDDHAAEFKAQFEQVPPAERSLDRAVDVLWSIASGPSYVAVLEVVVAARTDEELRAVVQGVATVLERTVVDLVLWFSPDLAADPDLARRVIDLAFAIVQGAAISRLCGFGQPDEVVALAKSLSGVVVGHAISAPPTRQSPPSTLPEGSA